MFESKVVQFFLVTLRLSLFNYATVLLVGVIAGSSGTYAAWMDLAGRYEELGLVPFALWILFQTPVFLATIDLPRAFYFPLTFTWWFLIGSSLVFLFLLIMDSFNSLDSD